MNKQEIANRVAEVTGQTKKHALEMVEAVFEVIKEALVAGEKVSIYQFGKFEVKERPERTGHNPKTMEPIVIPAGRSLKFKPAGTLKETLKK